MCFWRNAHDNVLISKPCEKIKARWQEKAAAPWTPKDVRSPATACVSPTPNSLHAAAAVSSQRTGSGKGLPASGRPSSAICSR